MTYGEVRPGMAFVTPDAVRFALAVREGPVSDHGVVRITWLVSRGVTETVVEIAYPRELRASPERVA